MKNLIMFACFVFLIGCDKSKTQYSGNVKTYVTNGNQHCIEVQFPGGSGLIHIRNAEDADSLIKQTESLLSSLKQARNQFPDSSSVPKLSEKERLIAQTEMALASIKNNKSSKEEDIRAIEALLMSLKTD